MQQKKYTKKLYSAIRKLNLDQEELVGLILCLYINGCSSEDCAKLFGITEDKIIKFLKSEELYCYQACSKCERLRDRENDFHRYKNRKFTICNDCKKEYIKKYNKEYRENNENKINQYTQKFNKINKIYMKKYNRIYYKNNKEKKKNHMKKYNQKNAPIKMIQKLDMFEEVSGNQVRCKYCGRWMIPTISQVVNRLRGIKENDKGYIYCSEECKEECPTYGQVKYPKGFKQASSREVNPVLRQLVLKRDNYTCQKCGKTQEELTVGLHCHHITPVVNSPIEANDPKNCITLCKDCHKEVHKIPGCGYHELKCV